MTDPLQPPWPPPTPPPVPPGLPPHYRPNYEQGPPPPPVPKAPAYASVAVLVVSIIGLIMSQTDVTLSSGTGLIWTGFAISAGAAVIALFIPGLPMWVKVIAVLIACFTLGQAIYDQMWINQQRREIQDILNNPFGNLPSDFPTDFPPS
jgi:hypothetical protein